MIDDSAGKTIVLSQQHRVFHSIGGSELAPTSSNAMAMSMAISGSSSTTRNVRPRNPDDIRSAAQDAWSVDRVLVLWPTVPALQRLVRAYGFEIESMYDWRSRLADRARLPGLEGYAKGKRVTVRCRGRCADRRQTAHGSGRG